jgi:transcriptional regulator with XRE-family HTH domain
MPAQWHDALMDMRARIMAVIEANSEMSVRKVSLAAGLSDSMLHKFLTGATDSITIKSAEKIAAALKVDPRWLIFGEGDPDEASDIASLIRRIPPKWHDQALAVLQTFARTGTHG